MQESIPTKPMGRCTSTFICLYPGRKASSMSHLLGPASPPSSQTHLLSSLTTCMQKSERQTASLKSQTLNLTALILLAPTMTMPGSLRKTCLWQLLRKLLTNHSPLLLPNISMQQSQTQVRTCQQPWQPMRTLPQTREMVHLILSLRLTASRHHQSHLPSVVSLTWPIHV